MRYMNEIMAEQRHAASKVCRMPRPVNGTGAADADCAADIGRCPQPLPAHDLSEQGECSVRIDATNLISPYWDADGPR